MSDDPKNLPPETDAVPERKWTVLLYMAGDNNLSEECVYSLTEAKTSIDDANRRLTVLAQFDPSGVTAQTKRYKLSHRLTLSQDADQTGWVARETDTGEPHNLLEFIRWGISTYPAEHFMVVLAGHGSGTDDDYLLRDENPPNALGILEMQEVFKQLTHDGHEIDILGFDTCLMNMAEVCFELSRTSITYLVGSEGFSPNTGWPYMEIIRVLNHKIKTDPDKADPKWLATEIVSLYQQFYKPYINGGISVDQSVLEVAKIEDVKEAFFLLVRSLIKEAETKQLEYGWPKNNALILAHWETQSYNGEVFVDLFDFCARLALRYPKEPKSDVIALCGKVQEEITKLVVKTCTAGSAFQFSFGASVYFPWAILAPKYGNLSWPKETKWLDFLKLYHEETRRPGRDGIRFTEDIPGRAAVPTTKGRNGRVESMRNPPISEWNECVAREMTTRTAGRRTVMKRPTSKKTYKSRKRSAKKTAKSS